MSGFRAKSLGGVLSLCCVLALGVGAASEAEVIRREIEPGVLAILKEGRTLGLEVRPPTRDGARRLLSKYLEREGGWKAYQGRLSSFIPFAKLKREYKREVLLTIYAYDFVDDRGWTHTAIRDGETLWSISEWITGTGANHAKIVADPRNDVGTALRKGERVLIPMFLLREPMSQPTPRLLLEPQPELADLEEGLLYGSDGRGPFAAYKLRKGETLYSSVVARYTDFTDNADVLEACEIIAARSAIRDVRTIEPGTTILIPIGLVADKYQPPGTVPRLEYEATLREAVRLRGNQGRSKDLSDVVVILDPGHGGQDHGASHVRSGLYEDEINYDIVVRIKEILETRTGATVYVTMIDRSSGMRPTERTKFVHDTDEELLTNPRHGNSDGAKVSANLRWMLTNAIYEREVKRGIDPKKIVFTSVHTDSIFDGRIRGAMIYIPGAKYRRGEEVRRDSVYAKYAEGRSNNRFQSSAAERRRDEALSRNFANILLDEFGRKRIKRHVEGDAIRSQIRRSRTKVFVPAVLRNSKVPTKILVETANLNNETDRQRLADPWWREQFAKAYVDALLRYYGSNSPVKVARGR